MELHWWRVLRLVLSDFNDLLTIPLCIQIIWFQCDGVTATRTDGLTIISNGRNTVEFDTIFRTFHSSTVPPKKKRKQIKSKIKQKKLTTFIEDLFSIAGLIAGSCCCCHSNLNRHLMTFSEKTVSIWNISEIFVYFVAVVVVELVESEELFIYCVFQ